MTTAVHTSKDIQERGLVAKNDGIDALKVSASILKEINNDGVCHCNEFLKKCKHLPWSLIALRNYKYLVLWDPVPGDPIYARGL